MSKNINYWTDKRIVGIKLCVEKKDKEIASYEFDYNNLYSLNFFNIKEDVSVSFANFFVSAPSDALRILYCDGFKIFFKCKDEKEYNDLKESTIVNIILALEDENEENEESISIYREAYIEQKNMFKRVDCMKENCLQFYYRILEREKTDV